MTDPMTVPEMIAFTAFFTVLGAGAVAALTVVAVLAVLRSKGRSE